MQREGWREANPAPCLFLCREAKNGLKGGEEENPKAHVTGIQRALQSPKYLLP